MTKRAKKPTLVTFGDVGSPETNRIDIELGDEFQCPCGHIMDTHCAWLAAHWDEHLKRSCEKCQQEFRLLSGRVSLGVGKWNTPTPNR